MRPAADICSDPSLLTVDDALAIVLTTVRRTPRTETVPLKRSAGRVVASSIVTSMPLPPFNQSAVDGYGIHCADLTAVTKSKFQHVGTTYAGARQMVCPNPGQTVRLLTGAQIPQDVAAVVMEEQARIVGTDLTFDRHAKNGLNIRRQGEDVEPGSTIVEAGTVIDARHVAIMAASGVSKISVERRINVGVLSTGNELVPAHRPLAPHQIHDSNGPMLSALLEAPAVRVTSLGCCVDDRKRLTRRLAQIARAYDLVVCSGGVSGSDADHIVASVVDAGGTCKRLSLAVKPGKPLAVGIIGNTGILALPGNPFASLVGALLFARPLLQALTGSYNKRECPQLALTRGIFTHAKGRLEFVPVRVVAFESHGIPLLEKLGRGGSARLSPLITADGLASLPADIGDMPPGSRIDYYPFDTAFRL